jgi:sugar phosphate isomerase/epimerase
MVASAAVSSIREGRVSVNPLCFESIQWSPFIADGRVDLPAQIDAAAEAGFDGFSFDIWSLRGHLAQGGSLEGLADRLAATGLRCLELQALVVTDDPAETGAAAEEMVAAVAVLAPTVVMGGFPGAPTDRAVANLVDAVDQLPAGTPIGIEFLPTLAIDDIAKARALVARVGVPGVGVVVDAWHFFHGPSTWEDLDALPLSEITFVQFSDHPPLESDDLASEMLRRRVFPGDGVLDLERFTSVLRAKGYTGVVGVEVISEPLRALGYTEFARRSREAAARYWS